jgi:chromosomal replication initiator protein
VAAVSPTGAAAAGTRSREGPRQVPKLPDHPPSGSRLLEDSDTSGIGDGLDVIWEEVTDRLRTSVPESTFKLWLEPLRPAALRGDTLYVRAPDGIRAWVERRYASLIARALEQMGAGVRAVSFAAPGAGATAAEEGNLTLNPSYTFDRFVIGEGNRLAHAAALAVAEAPAESYNPLFLHGPPGLGKTHLLTAIANYLQANAPELNVRYSTAEAFTNEFVGALKASGSEAFKRRYRDIDVLLVDDVQFLEGKRHTEEEFFHTFNALYEAGSQLVLSADRIPSRLETLEERLRDRFEWGLTVEVGRPTLATRLTVLRRLVRESGVDAVGDDALTELARRIDANIRQLHGALTRVIAHASLRARPLTPELVEELIPLASERQEPDVVEAIQQAAAECFNVPTSTLAGPSRAAAPLRARQLAIYLCREMTDLSLTQIGARFGARDHATVLNAIRRVEGQCDADQAGTRERLQELRDAIHNQPSAAA